MSRRKKNAPEPHPGVTRREMLAMVGASLSLAGLTACRRPVEKIVPFVSSPEEVIPGVPRHYATTMPFGRSAYGLLVETHDGHPTKIEGNRLHPSTAGASSAWMQASILDLYDPDRSSAVRRAGERTGWADFVSFWEDLHAGYAESGGDGLAVLSESFASPTLARLREQLRQAFPETRWVTYEPVSAENVHRGLELATGSAYEPKYALETASTVLALDADFLLLDPENVAHARGFCDARRVRTENDSMNRLYVVESGFSITGAMADQRLPLRSSELGDWLSALAAELATLGLAIEAPAAARRGFDRRWLTAVAGDLLDQRGRGLIIAGWNQPAEVHGWVFALNTALGNVGRTVTYHALDDADRPDRHALGSLTRAMRAGEVSTLVILGGNPVYNAPADLAFGNALAGVEHTVHLSSHYDETSRATEWHLPRAHYLEAWGDCRALGGTLGVTQPVVQPLYGGRSPVELLALMESCEERPGYDEVRLTWAAILGDIEFERKWNRVLHDGLLEGSGEPGSAPRLRQAALPAPPAAEAAGADELELVFRPSEALFDGRFANVAWLQELPGPVTKLTWDNPALLSPRTMKALGLRNEDVVRLRYRGLKLELPVWSQPGQADGSLTLTLGYGRSAAGRLGDGVGFDTYTLRALASFGLGLGLQLEKTDRTHALASTQDHGGMEGRPIVREATLEGYRRRPEFAREAVAVPPLTQLFDDQPYDEGYQWGMSIDLNACTGCNACVIACQSENNIPIVGKEQVMNGREMHWLRMDRYFVTEADESPSSSPEVRFQPVPCMHCENAPCEQVCPVGATVHDAEGLNAMVYNRCIGTRYCSNNCPYKVRRFNYYNLTGDTPEIMKLAQNPDVTVRSRGVIEKCTYCTQRINAAKIKSRLEGRAVADGEFQTACEQACPAGAIVFGNILDPESRVSGSKRQNRSYALLEELNNRPRTTFLAKLRNPHPELAK